MNFLVFDFVKFQIFLRPAIRLRCWEGAAALAEASKASSPLPSSAFAASSASISDRKSSSTNLAKKLEIDEIFEEILKKSTKLVRLARFWSKFQRFLTLFFELKQHGPVFRPSELSVSGVVILNNLTTKQNNYKNRWNFQQNHENIISFNDFFKLSSKICRFYFLRFDFS